jgi:hypothetical protein
MKLFGSWAASKPVFLRERRYDLHPLFLSHSARSTSSKGMDARVYSVFERDGPEDLKIIETMEY